MGLLREKFSLRFQLESSTHYQRKVCRLDQFLDISLNGLKTIVPRCVSKDLLLIRRPCKGYPCAHFEREGGPCDYQQQSAMFQIP